MTTQLAYNETVLERFKSFIKNNRLAHAYILVGPEGVGKFETALAVAKMVNCEAAVLAPERGFCDQCPACRTINSRNHPDLHILETARGETIQIEHIRDLITQMQMRPFEAKKKIFLIRNSENLTLPAGNALLKTLEEPFSDTLILLTTAVPEKNLSTIRSRCQMIYLAPYSKQRLADYLAGGYDMKVEAAQFVASFSEGCLTRAKRLQEENILPRKNEIINNFIFSRDSENFLKKILVEPQATKELLDVVLTWFRDVLVFKLTDDPARLVHQDRIEDLKRAAKSFSLEDLENITEETVRTLKLLNENLNVKIALSVLKEKIWVRS